MGGFQNTGKVQLLSISLKKGGKEDRFVSLTSIPRKILEQITKQTICKPLEDNKKMSDSQHGFVRNKSCQTNFISSCDRVTGFVDRAEAVDAMCLDFSEVSDNVSPDTVVVRKGNIG